MMDNCPYCGAEVKKYIDKIVCYNCGIIEDNQESKESNPTYIG